MAFSGERYLYITGCQAIEADLCRLEMKSLFGTEIAGRCFFSNIIISPSRSPFIKYRLTVRHSAASFEDLASVIADASAPFTSYRFEHFKTDKSELDYDEWMRSIRLLCSVLNGRAVMENPGVLLGLVLFQGEWLFGESEKNDYEWKWHDQKPHSNSHSLSLRTARALVNIAVGGNVACRLVDPCCGVGTVVLEAASMDVDVRGFEINRIIATKAKQNLATFGCGDLIECGDMHDIIERYDVAIVDIPYGLFTPVTAEQQDAIIHTARRIADRLILVSFEDMDAMLAAAGFAIVDRCEVVKGKFRRRITVCR